MRISRASSAIVCCDGFDSVLFGGVFVRVILSPGGQNGANMSAD
jgi:hypothetical protein